MVALGPGTNGVTARRYFHNRWNRCPHRHKQCVLAVARQDFRSRCHTNEQLDMDSKRPKKDPAFIIHLMLVKSPANWVRICRLIHALYQMWVR